MVTKIGTAGADNLVGTDTDHPGARGGGRNNRYTRSTCLKPARARTGWPTACEPGAQPCPHAPWSMLTLSCLP